MHPNGSFVLVKRELSISQHPPQSPTPQNHTLPNASEDSFKKLANNNDSSSSNGHFYKEPLMAAAMKNPEVSEDEEDIPIIPEMLKNQIKIEPISEDEEEETLKEANHINISNSFSLNHQNAPQYNNSNSSVSKGSENQAAISDGSDPNQQLLVLSNPRIGDGPGEYLCNVCHAKFVYKNNLKSHLKRHLGIYP